MDDKDIEVRFSTKNLPFEYKLLEYRLIINKGLYDEKIIDLKTYNEMEKTIMARLKKKNWKVFQKIINCLTSFYNDATFIYGKA